MVEMLKISYFEHWQNQNSTTKTAVNKVPPLIPVSSNGLRVDNLSSLKSGAAVNNRNGVDKHKLVDVPTFRPDSTRNDFPYKVRKVRLLFYLLK